MEKPKKHNYILGGFILALLALLCVATIQAEAELYEYVGTSHSVMNAIGMDARAASLGWAVTSLDMGVAGLEFNPASLAFQQSGQLYFGHSRWVMDIPMDQVLIARPLPGQSTLAFGLMHMDMGSVQETLEDGTYTGESLGARDMQFSMNFTMPVHPMVRAGARASFIYKSLGDDRAGTFTGSLGVLTREIQGIRLGASLTDVGPPLKFIKKSFASPWQIRFGASHRLELAEGHRLLNSLDLIYPQGNYPSVGFGSEWTWSDMVFLRVGYRRSVQDDGMPEGDRFHYGGGLRVNHFRFDYSYNSRADLQGAHRLSVTYDLGGDVSAETPKASRYVRGAMSDELQSPLPPDVRVITEEPPVEPAADITIFRYLAFSADRSRLLSGQHKVLDDLVKRLEAVPDLIGIELQGYEEDSGEAIWDRKRSLQKLQAFKSELVVRGVPADKIGLVAYGSDRFTEDDAESRIEVHLIK
jgi:outer membrane protein OmpA-like peptidoglycan-associated protein